MDEIKTTEAILPDEIVLSIGSQCGVCPGDGCNADQGGCVGDGSCGQDC